MQTLKKVGLIKMKAIVKFDLILVIKKQKLFYKA